MSLMPVRAVPFPRATVFLAFAVMSVAAACSAGGSPSGPVVDVASARAAWADTGIGDYRYDFDRQCFCLPAAVEPVTVEVRDGRVAAVISRRTGDLVEPAVNVTWYTMEDLFGLIEGAEAGGTEVQVEYSEAGYPTRIMIGSLAADAGVEYRIANVTPL